MHRLSPTMAINFNILMFCASSGRDNGHKLITVDRWYDVIVSETESAVVYVVETTSSGAQQDL